VDHSCPKCGLAVASGTPFCSGCRAPQIRFVPAEPLESVVRADPALDERLPASTPLVWQPALRAAILGGVFSALTMGLFPGLLGFGFMGGGTLAIYAYRKRVPGAILNLGAGALLGAVSGLFGFLVLSVLALLKLVLLHKGEEFRQTIFAALDKGVQNSDPQLQPQVLAMVQNFKTPEGFVIMTAIVLVAICLLFVFFSILGGAIGANITRRNHK